MDYFSPGLREIARFARRTGCRARRALACRDLARAETQLGLLAWQQADFDAETQRQVDALQNVELEQARVQNELSIAGLEIEKLLADRAQQRADAQAGQTKAEVECAEARKSLAEAEAKLSETELMPKPDQRAGALEAEEARLETKYRKVLNMVDSRGGRTDELVRIREQLLTVQNQRRDLRVDVARGSDVIRELRERVQAAAQRVHKAETDLRDGIAAAKAKDDALAEELRRAERRRAELQASMDQLERSKLQPYREIGRVLADCGISPVNQPGALSRVLALREQIALREQSIAHSLEQAAAEDRQLVRISLFIWAVLAVAVGLVVGAML